MKLAELWKSACFIPEYEKLTMYYVVSFSWLCTVLLSGNAGSKVMKISICYLLTKAGCLHYKSTCSFGSADVIMICDDVTLVILCCNITSTMVFFKS